MSSTPLRNMEKSYMSNRGRFSRAVVSVLTAFLIAALATSTAVSANAAQKKVASQAFPSVPANTKVSIKIASYLPVLGAAAISTLNGFITGFEKVHPNITVTLEPEASTAAGAISGQVQQDAIAGQVPDVVQIPFGEMLNLVHSFNGVNLTTVVGPTSLAAEWGGANPYAPAITKLGEIDGNVYAIPWTLSTPLLFYNADLFKAAGLDPATPPTTWAQVNRYASALKKLPGVSGIVDACIGAASSGLDWCLQSMIFSASGTVMNAKRTAPTFNNPQLLTAMKALQSLGKSDAIDNLTTAQAIQAWGAGKLGMILNTSALQSSLIKANGGHFEMRVANEPGFGHDISVPTNSGSGLVILSKNKLKQEAAWSLIQYLTSAASMTTVTENIGYAPLRPSIVNLPQYLKGWATAQPYLAPAMDQLSRVKQWQAYPGPNYAALSGILVNAATAITFQGADPKSTMDDAQSQAVGLMK